LNKKQYYFKSFSLIFFKHNVLLLKYVNEQKLRNKTANLKRSETLNMQFYVWNTVINVINMFKNKSTDFYFHFWAKLRQLPHAGRFHRSRTKHSQVYDCRYNRSFRRLWFLKCILSWQKRRFARSRATTRRVFCRLWIMFVFAFVFDN